MTMSLDMGNSRWTKPRIARAAFLAGGGCTQSEVASDPLVASTPFAVDHMARRYGIAFSDAPAGNLLLQVPRKLMLALEEEALRRRQTPEALASAVMRILAAEPVLLANVLDDEA